jgi:hypothetical protein
LIFTTKKNINVANTIAITSELTEAEAYDSKLQVKDVVLGIHTSSGFEESGLYELHQNTPNPFENETSITFNLPNADYYTLSIYDVTGKILRVYNQKGIKGLNSIILKRADLEVRGVLYYQLDVSGFTDTKRMVLLD